MISLLRLQMQYCKLDCHHEVSKCPIQYEYKGMFCSLCGGVIFEFRIRDKKPISYRGGYIPLVKENLEKYHYACSCQIGQIRKKQGVKEFVFHDDNRCYRLRIRQQLQFRVDMLNDRFPERKTKEELEITRGWHKRTLKAEDIIKKTFDAEEIK